MKKRYGRVGIKRVYPELEDLPDDCGYRKRFKFNIDMHSNGIMGECIAWCQLNCKGKWGWYFESAGRIEQSNEYWEDQRAFMSFQRKRDAMRFWLAIGLINIGNDVG